MTLLERQFFRFVPVTCRSCRTLISFIPLGFLPKMASGKFLGAAALAVAPQSEGAKPGVRVNLEEPSWS